jgi:protein-disulfide isomerase
MMMTKLRSVALAAGLFGLVPMAHAGDSFSEAQRKEIGEIVRAYLLENPEVLLEVSRELDSRQQQAEAKKRDKALTANAAEIFNSEHDFVAGNPKGDVTMVEFFDYNCGWCKKGFPEVMSLLEKDKNLRLVLKEFPIFGGDSDYAAMAAIASRKQGKYWEFHRALLGHEGKVTAEIVDATAEKVGLDLKRLKADMKDKEVARVIDDNHKLAEKLAISGTPAFIIDNNLVPGYLPADGLMATINDVRAGGGCKLC